VTTTLDLRIGNRLQEIPEAAARIEDFAEHHALPSAAVARLNLCLDELLTNIVRYAFEEAGSHTIAIRVTALDGRLRAEIADNGRPFDPLTQAPEPDVDANLEDRAVGGLGVYLVKQLMDRAEYAYRDGQNQITIECGLG
jgi:anti-sigma regulatory factor (Ser/Thr protein kinase)